MRLLLHGTDDSLVLRKTQLEDLKLLLKLQLKVVGNKAAKQSRECKDLSITEKFRIWSENTTKQSRKKYHSIVQLQPQGMPDFWDLVSKMDSRGRKFNLDAIQDFLQDAYDDDEEKIEPYLQLLMDMNVESLTCNW